MNNYLVGVLSILFVILICLVDFLDGRPVYDDTGEYQGNVESAEDGAADWRPAGLVAIVVSAAVTVSIVMSGLVCLCCRGLSKSSIQVPQSGVPVSVSTGSNSSSRSTEFTIFPPAGSHHLVEQSGEDDIKFEPLPDIRPRRQNSDASVSGKPRPATFRNVVSRGLSFQDWFEDPYSNFPRTQLQYVHELGSGWFGQVVEGEAFGIVPTQKKSRVVVKILMEGANTTDQMYFLHEVKPFRDLEHPNVLKLLGKCLENDPFLIILEYCAFKNLKSYLIQQRANSDVLLQQNVLLRMSCDVAAGLQHLHEHGFVLTDLAARNCLVTHDLTVKVGDYGNGIELFKDDYYCAGGIAVPVRWCAPETLRCTETIMETREVTQEANIWSFGVVLWEILEFGKLPYVELNDDELIQKVITEQSERLKKPMMPYFHLDRLFQIIQLCQLSAKCRPNMERIGAMLSHLSLYPSANRDASSEFEARWNLLNPRGSPNRQIDWQTGSSEFDRASRELLSPSPHTSLSCDSDFQQPVTSASLQNLRGSLDDVVSLAERYAPMDAHSGFQLLDGSFTRSASIGNGDLFPADVICKSRLIEGRRNSSGGEKEISPFTRELEEVIRKLDEDLDRECPSLADGGGGGPQVGEGASEAARSDSLVPSDDQNMASMCSEGDMDSLAAIIAAGPASLQDVAAETQVGGETGGDSGGGYRSIGGSSSSDDEEKSWKKMVETSSRESGEITRIVCEKSQSVQDFLKLTVIDSESGSDSDGVSPSGSQEADAVGGDDGRADDLGEEETGRQQVRPSAATEDDRPSCLSGDRLMPRESAASHLHVLVAGLDSSITPATNPAKTTSALPPVFDQLAMDLVLEAVGSGVREAAVAAVLSFTSCLTADVGDRSNILTELAPVVAIPDIVIDQVPDLSPGSEPEEDDEEEAEVVVRAKRKSDLNFRFVFKSLNYDDWDVARQHQESCVITAAVDLAAEEIESSLSCGACSTSTPHSESSGGGGQMSSRLIDFGNVSQLEPTPIRAETLMPDSNLDESAEANGEVRNHWSEEDVFVEIAPALSGVDRGLAEVGFCDTDVCLISFDDGEPLSGFFLENVPQPAADAADASNVSSPPVIVAANEDDDDDCRRKIDFCNDSDSDVVDEGFSLSEADDEAMPNDSPLVAAVTMQSNDLTDEMTLDESGDDEEDAEDILLVDLETNEAVLVEGPHSMSWSSSSFVQKKVTEKEEQQQEDRSDTETKSDDDSVRLEDLSLDCSCVENASVNGFSGSSLTSSSGIFRRCLEQNRNATEADNCASLSSSSFSSPENGDSCRSSDSSNYSLSTEDEFQFEKGGGGVDEVPAVTNSNRRPSPLKEECDDEQEQLEAVQLRPSSSRKQREHLARFEVHQIPQETLNYLAQLSPDEPTSSNAVPPSPQQQQPVTATSEVVDDRRAVEDLKLCKLSSLAELDVVDGGSSPNWLTGTETSSSSSSCLSPASSSTSGEFDCTKQVGYSVFMEEHDPDAWHNEDEVVADDEMEDEVGSFQISTWNKDLTPTKSLLRSPEKRAAVGAEKKAVSFKLCDKSVIYEYPKEEVAEDERNAVDSSSSLWRLQVYNPELDYSSYADWDLANEEIPDDLMEMEDYEDDDDGETSADFVPLGMHTDNEAYQLYKLSNIDDDAGPDYGSEFAGSSSTSSSSFYGHPDSFDFATYLAHYNGAASFGSSSSGLANDEDEDFWLETILNPNDFFVSGSDGPFEFSVDSLDPSELPQWALSPGAMNMYAGWANHHATGQQSEQPSDGEYGSDDGGGGNGNANNITLLEFQTGDPDGGGREDAVNLRTKSSKKEQFAWEEVDSGESVESDQTVAMETDSVEDSLVNGAATPGNARWLRPEGSVPVGSTAAPAEAKIRSGFDSDWKNAASRDKVLNLTPGSHVENGTVVILR